jgi:hypothetical protein
MLKRFEIPAMVILFAPASRLPARRLASILTPNREQVEPEMEPA